MDLLEVLKMLPSAGMAAIAIYVMKAFMGQQSVRDDKYVAALANQAASFERNLTALASQFSAGEKEGRAQIQSLFTDYTDITRETVVAIKALESAVRVLDSRITQIDTDRRLVEWNASHPEPKPKG